MAKHLDREDDYSREETANGSSSSVCSLLGSNHNGCWKSYQVQTTQLQFPCSFLILHSNLINNGCYQSFEAYFFTAHNQSILNMILCKLEEKKKNDKLSQVPGKSDVDARENSEYTPIILTQMNNSFEVRIGVDNGHGMAAAATDEKHFHEGDDEKFYLQTSEKLAFTNEELEYPNNILKNVMFPELQRMKLADLSLPTFSINIVWSKPQSPQVGVNVIIEVIAYGHNGESTKSSVTYPVQFNNFEAKSFISTADLTKNRKAINQLYLIFTDATQMIEEVDSIIAFLSNGEHLTEEDVHGLSTSKEKAGELLHHVIYHENVMPAFLEALRSTRHPQNMELVELITNPKPKEETSATELR